LLTQGLIFPGSFCAAGEQSGTESRLWTCHSELSGTLLPLEPRQKLGASGRVLLPERRAQAKTMERAFRRLGNRLRSGLALLRKAFAKPGGNSNRDPDLGRDLKSQRMCPSCGLITSSYKTCCLECGKTLKPA